MFSNVSHKPPGDPPVCAHSYGSSRLALPQGRDVHVWLLDLHNKGRDGLSLLDTAETTRAQRFIHSHEARRYVAAHAWLRRILARYTGILAERLRFGHGPYGKPELLHATDELGRPLNFNLSRSKDWGLLAVAGGVELGVDIEVVRADLPGADLAADVLTNAERGELDALPHAKHADAFVGCWTRKEACLKSLGVGPTGREQTFNA